jgi:hypothetical protein
LIKVAVHKSTAKVAHASFVFAKNRLIAELPICQNCGASLINHLVGFDLSKSELAEFFVIFNRSNSP